MSLTDDLRINLSTDRSSRLKCMECGHKNPAGVAFCTKCRAKMVLECADCGFKSPQGSEFCGSCGNETEFGIKERQSRERKEAKAVAKRRPRAEEAELREKQKREEAELREKQKRIVELTRFGGHLISQGERSPNAKNETGVCAGVSTTDGGAGPIGL